jgi:hypothetical protein
MEQPRVVIVSISDKEANTAVLKSLYASPGIKQARALAKLADR